ncbi:MAG: hypothetical protein ACQEP9_04350 [Bacillota bacterium]
MTWYIPSIVNCLFELLETELPIVNFVDNLYQVGTERIEYVINLPRFLYLLFTTEEKTKIVLTEIQRLKYKNQHLLNLLLRELNHLYFEFINETENDNDLVDRVWVEIYFLIELVKEWNCRGLSIKI